MASPYQVLGVDPDADRETVERRYRELVKEVHPDAGGSAEEFKRVKRAYRAIVSDRRSGSDSQGGAAGASGRDRTGQTGPGSSRSGSGAGTAGNRTGSTGGQTGSGKGTGGSSGRGTGSDRRTGATSGGDGNSSRQYTAAGRGSRAAGAGTGTSGATGSRRSGSAGSGTAGSGAAGSRTGSSANRTPSGGGDSAWVPRRWFLYGFSAIFAGAAYALRDQTLSDILSEDSGGGEPERSAASGLPREDTASREVGPEDLFDVEFETPAESTVHFTVDGADSRDWINVYTREEYERVASEWDGEGGFDPGEPLETVLTNDGYVADLPEAGTYVILIKLWAGPPNDPREPRTVEVDYQVTA